MALVLEANYSKKLGLPGYSSHQYMVTVRTELADLNQVEAESKKLYSLLQACVDREIQTTGFLPFPRQNAKASPNGAGSGQANGNHPQNGDNKSGDWKCSPKQKELILDLMAEYRLEKVGLEQMAQQMFGTSVPQLNKLQASGLINEITSQHNNGSSRNGGNGHPSARPRSVAGGQS